MRKVGCKAIRFRIVYRFKDKYSITNLCHLLEVSRSGYYKWLKTKDSPDRDAHIAVLIRQCHQKTYRTYGYRRMKTWLFREAGVTINHKAVLRIMRKYDLLAYRKRKRFTVYKSMSFHRYDNLLNRDFTASRPNEKWVTDISYIYTKQGFFYLSVIRDLYDRSIVTYKYATKQSSMLVTSTVADALHKEKISKKLILHSDQGFQYTSTLYHNVVKSYGIEASMSRRGNPYDNAMAENFFSILKTECLYRAKPQTIDEAKALIDEYIYFYNNDRIQLKTGMTPLEVRSAASN